MPLQQGRDNAAVSDNIKELMATGRPQQQAIAIAMRVAGRARQPAVKKEHRAVRVTRGQ